MKPVLFEIRDVSLLHVLAMLAIVIIGVGIWLLILRRKQAYTRDHLITGTAITGMAALFLLIILHAGHFSVHSYGAMLMLGFIAGIITATRLALRRGVPAERLLDLGLVILVCSIVGARVLYLMITKNAGPLLDMENVLQNGIGGLSFHGGLIGAVLGSLIYVRIAKLNYWRVADCMAPGIAIGYAITRIGCFLNGCCYGKHCDLPWATTFAHSPDGFIANVHPTQIYASLMGLAMFGILLLLSRGQSLGRSGRLLMVFLVLEGIERFVMEIFRQPDPNFHGLLTPAQMFSIVLAVLGVLGWFLLPKKAAVDALPAPEQPAVATAK